MYVSSGRLPFVLGPELWGRERLLRGQDWGRDWLSFVSGGVLVCIYLDPSFCLFPLTDCVAFWRVECLGTQPTTSRPNLALGTSHMVLAISLASCPSIITSAARLAQVSRGTSMRPCPPLILFLGRSGGESDGESTLRVGNPCQCTLLDGGRCVCALGQTAEVQGY